jgi:hypothetical protein
MGTKLLKIAAIAAGTTVTFAAGVGTGAVLVAYVVAKGSELLNHRAESDEEKTDENDKA